EAWSFSECASYSPAGPTASTKPSEFHFRHDESESWPTTGLNRSLEPLARLRLVASHEVPVAKPVRERGDLHFIGVRRRDHRFRTDLATIELQAPRVGVGHRLRIRPKIEHRLRLRAAPGSAERHP